MPGKYTAPQKDPTGTAFCGVNPCVQAKHSACRQVPLALLAQTYLLPDDVWLPPSKRSSSAKSL